MATVLLVRHGLTDWNEERRIQGWGPVPLNETGRAQARAAGRRLMEAYEVDRVVTSDLRRTEETTDLVVEAGVRAAVDRSAAWRERDFGVYQGFAYDDVFEANPELSVDDGIVKLDAAPESGESLRKMAERVHAGWDRLLADADDGETVLLVTHGGPIYLVLGRIKGLDVPSAIAAHHHDNCAITEIELDGGAGTVTVAIENDTDHLP